MLEHGGEVSGFTAENAVFPDDRAAIVVLVNQDSIGTSGTIGQKIAAILFAKGGAGPAEARARQDSLKRAADQLRIEQEQRQIEAQQRAALEKLHQDSIATAQRIERERAKRTGRSGTTLSY